MSRLIPALRRHTQSLVLLLWVCFIGVTVWQHAQSSRQPPIYDAYTYFLKANNVWAELHKLKPFNPFNVPPTMRPPGTVLMSYPFGFDADFRPFYFRSIFLPIVLICLAVVIGAHHRKLDGQDKWNLVLVAVFVSVTPCLYMFEVSPRFAAVAYWGMVDGFLSGFAALAAAALVRSVFAQSLGWLALAAVLSSVCFAIKPAGVLIMALTGLSWLGLGLAKWMRAWKLEEQGRKVFRWLAQGFIILTIPYIAVLAVAFSSEYFSAQNMALGNASIAIMKNELAVPWSELMGVIRLGGLGYAFSVWFVVVTILTTHYFWRASKDGLLSAKAEFLGFSVGAFITLLTGVWFWLFGSGGMNQIRYFMPFLFMAVLFNLPATLMAMRDIHGWKMALLAGFMLVPPVNMAILLPQRNPPLAWQLKTGVNLTSGSAEDDPVYAQAQRFAREVKQEGRNIVLYSFTRLPVDSFVQATHDYWRITKPPMPDVKFFRPVDWRRPSTFHLDEMLAADYWLFNPMRRQEAQTALNSHLLADSPPGLSQNDPLDKIITGGKFSLLLNELSLFEAWASQLTANEGVSIVSQSPTLRLLRIDNPSQLELAMDAFVSRHRWSSAFLAANPKRAFSEQEMEAELAKNPPRLEGVQFGDRFALRALSIMRNGEAVTVRIWWRPLSPIAESDWSLSIQVLDDKGDIVLNDSLPVYKSAFQAGLGKAFIYSELSFKNPAKDGQHRLGVGFSRPNQLSIADKGVRDMDGQRVSVPIP
jgi:hypothetical protein